MTEHRDPAATGHRIRSDDTWDLARKDYIAGYAARDVCARYGLNLSTFRTRARVEGWRRADLPDPEVLSFAEEDALDTGPPAAAGELADKARRAMARALDKGLAAEAQRFFKLARELRRLESEERQARRIFDERIRRDADPIEQAIRTARRTQSDAFNREMLASLAGEDTAALHPLHALHSEPGVQPLNRHQRRRQQALDRGQEREAQPGVSLHLDSVDDSNPTYCVR